MIHHSGSRAGRAQKHYFDKTMTGVRRPSNERDTVHTTHVLRNNEVFQWTGATWNSKYDGSISGSGAQTRILSDK